MSLDAQERMIIETRVASESPSTGVAYLLWFFTGGLGGHRFYLGKPMSGLAMLALFVLGWLTIIVGIGAIFFVVVGLWALIDAFLIPGMIGKKREKLRRRLTAEAAAIHGGISNRRDDRVAIEGSAARREPSFDLDATR